MAPTSKGLLPAPGTDYERGFELAERCELDHVEVFAEGDPWREGVLSDPDRVRDLSATHDVDVFAHLPFPLDLGSPIPELRAGALDALDRYLADLAAMDARKAVCHLDAPSGFATRATDDETRDRFVESARAAAERGADHGVEICVENLPSGPFTIDAFDDFLDRTDVPVTLDTGHAVLAGWTEAEVAALVREWPDRVSHVHLNDTRATAEAWAADDEHLPFGAGTVDFETLLAPAVDGDWTPSLTLEVVTWDDDYLELSASRLHDLV